MPSAWSTQEKALSQVTLTPQDYFSQRGSPCGGHVPSQDIYTKLSAASEGLGLLVGPNANISYAL